MTIWIDVDLCNGCKRCLKECPYNAIEMKDDKAYILDHGKVIAAGPPADIVRDELVRKSYLGNTFAGHEFDEKWGPGHD